MTRFRCNACQGEYDDISADGVEYRHTCPPVTEASVERAGRQVFVPLDQVRPTDTVRVLRAGTSTKVLVSDVLADDVRLDDRQSQRPAGVHRDENADPVPIKVGPPADRNRPIKAPGAGRTPI